MDQLLAAIAPSTSDSSVAMATDGAEASDMGDVGEELLAWWATIFGR